MFVRTSYEKYEERVNLFFKEVLSRVKDLQFYTSSGSKGGPIIAVQVQFVVVTNSVTLIFYFDNHLSGKTSNQFFACAFQ